MTGKYVSLLAALMLAACGGNQGADNAAPAGGQPTAEQSAASDDLAAGAEVPEAEDASPTATSTAAIENDAGASPTSAHVQLGTHSNRLSPTQPTSASPDFWMRG